MDTEQSADTLEHFEFAKGAQQYSEMPGGTATSVSSVTDLPGMW